jgi:hypothetical protein
MSTAAIALLKPIYSPKDLIEHHDNVARLVQEALTPDVDFGVIPGTGDKPSLYKPGAEKLCLSFDCRPEYELIEAEIDHHAEIFWVKRKKRWQNGERRTEEETGTSLGLYRYRYRCKIVSKSDGRVHAVAEGVCSTLEGKYVDRPRDTENTVCKMAQKRAFVAATLHAFALSNRFTQDIEDMDRETRVEARRAQQAKPAARPAQAQARQPQPEPPQAACAAKTVGRGSIYTGESDQQKIIETILRKRGEPEENWPAIDELLRGRPSGDLNTVIEEARRRQHSARNGGDTNGEMADQALEKPDLG